MTGSGLDRRGFLRRFGAASLGAIVGVAPGLSGGIAVAGPALGRGARTRAGDTTGGPDAVAGPEVARVWRAMGSLVEVRVQGLPEAGAVDAIRGVRRRFESLEAALTVYRPEAPLARLARSREGRWIDAPELLIAAMEEAGSAWERSGGAFDPTVSPMMRAWGLRDLDPRVPDPGFWREWLARPGWDGIELDRAGMRVRRLDRRLEVDLGGIGKGIAVDAALEELRSAGAPRALVNHGGSIGVLEAPGCARGGEKARCEGYPTPDPREGWWIGIAHPRREGEIWSTFRLLSGHLATSGDSERFVETAAGRRHHLLDPRTGDSVRGIAAVTAWAPTGMAADVASTVAFVEEGSAAGEPSGFGSVPRLALRDRGNGALGESRAHWPPAGATRPLSDGS